MNADQDMTLLLAPNYVKDVGVQFSEPELQDGRTRRNLIITLEVDDEDANKHRCLPGMDDFQFVAFLTPCIQTAILKTIQGHGKNNVKIEEVPEHKDDLWDDYDYWNPAEKK